MFKRISMALAIVLILSLASGTWMSASATPAHADTHYQYVDEFDLYIDFIVGDPDNPSPCDFNIAHHVYGNIRYNYWIDEYGQTTREIEISGNLKADFSANGKTLNVQIQGPTHYLYEYYPEYTVVTAKSTGTIRFMTVPHQGIIFGGAGQTIETLTFTPDFVSLIDYRLDKYVGNYNFDWGPFCEYLGP